MNYSLKKITTFTLGLIFCALFSPISVIAQDTVREDISDYIFYIEFIQGKPQISTDAKYPYYIIPVIEHSATLSSGEFRGEIVSGKGKLLSNFWFNAPTTTIIALGKSRIDIHAPYFANADRVNFYTRNGSKPLFTISVKTSSFCNDNNKCEKEIGEDYFNCSNDCSAPIKTATTPDTPIPGTTETTSPPPTPSVVTQTTESKVNLPSINEGTTTRTIGTMLNSKSSVVQLTIGIFLVLFSFVGYLAWKKRTSSEGFE